MNKTEIMDAYAVEQGFDNFHEIKKAFRNKEINFKQFGKHFNNATDLIQKKLLDKVANEIIFEKQIKGLIEVTIKSTEQKILLNPLNYDFIDCCDHCSVDTPNNNESFFLISETYEQVQELIKKSQ